MPYAEDDLLPISALQHLLFCERQCALIHVERQWAENRLTMEGQYQHRKAHDGPDATRDGVRTVRGLSLRSLDLGLIGQADVVEFEPPPEMQCSEKTVARQIRAALRNAQGYERFEGASSRAGTSDSAQSFLSGWTITPVEYKRGRPKRDDCDRVQVCAQAICLEEMLGVQIDAGSLFYGLRRRRTEVTLDEPLRRKTRDTAARLHEMIRAGVTPRARREPKCDGCSLFDLCIPESMGSRRDASRFFDRQLEQSLCSDGPLSDFTTED